jgi:hypothetical protein
MRTPRLLPSAALAVLFHVLGAGHALAITPTPTPAATPTPTPALAEIPLAASAVTASTNDGNVPANTIDNNLSTRWAGYGDGAWIRFDLGTSRMIAAIKVAAYRGNERQNRFDIQESSDGSTWSTILLGAHTSGTTTQEEVFELPDHVVRYLRYFGHGSSVGLWNSVTEVSLLNYDAHPKMTVSVSKTSVVPGDTVTVTASVNMGLNAWGLTVIDNATGQEQDQANPIFNPARPAGMTTSGGTASWTLTAVRAGTVRFRAGSNGEFSDPNCGCFYFTNASAESVNVTVTGSISCPTPTPPPAPVPINPTVVGGSGYVVFRWQSAYASTDAHRYEVFRALTGSSAWEQVATLDFTGSRDGRYDDYAVVDGTSYDYAVREVWSFTFGTPPCPVRTYGISSPFTAAVTMTPGISTGTEVTPARAAVTASTNDGNVPGNTVDNNLSTRWSGNGDGAWLSFDLGTPRVIDYLKIGVYKGNERRNKLEIQVSNDNATWFSVWRGESTGLSASEEIYNVSNYQARFVRYLGHMSNVGTFNSVAEVSIFVP